MKMRSLIVQVLFPASAILTSAMLLDPRIDGVPAIKLRPGALAAYTLGSVLLGPVFAGYYSSAGVIQNAVAQGAPQLHFQFEAPLSAYWYAPGKVAFDLLSPEQVVGEQASFFVVRNKHEQTFRVSFGRWCGTDSPLGKWQILRCQGPKFN